MTPGPWDRTARLPIELHPGDVVLVRGTSWISRQILKATRSRHEEPSVVSHVGMIDVGGALPHAEILEAVGVRVKRRTMLEAYGAGSSGIAIARPVFLTPGRCAKLLAASRRQEGETYGFLKLPLHLLDAWIGWALRMSSTPVLFRKIGKTKHPICSFHVAKSYRAAGYRFGRPGLYAAPDDIYDHILADAGNWSWVVGPDLAPLAALL